MTDQNSVETISIKMNWQQAAVIIAAALEDGTGKGKDMAREELQRMALVADSAMELQDELDQMKEQLAELKFAIKHTI